MSGLECAGAANLQAVEFDPPYRLVLSDRDVLREGIVAHVKRKRVAVLIDAPLAAIVESRPVNVSNRKGAGDEKSSMEKNAFSAHNLVVSEWPVPTYLACKCSSCA